MKNSTKEFFAIMGIIFLFGTTAGIIAACQKTQAAPRVLSAIACTDTAGVYVPVAVSTFNAGTVTFNPAHFMRICNEVYVSGTLSATAPDTAQSSLIQVSLPFASDLNIPPFNGGGQALITFFGGFPNVTGSVGFVHLVGSTGIVISWQATKKNPYGLIYNFSYTIK